MTYFEKQSLIAAHFYRLRRQLNALLDACEGQERDYLSTLNVDAVDLEHFTEAAFLHYLEHYTRDGAQKLERRIDGAGILKQVL